MDQVKFFLIFVIIKRAKKIVLFIMTQKSQKKMWLMCVLNGYEYVVFLHRFSIGSIGVYSIHVSLDLFHIFIW